MNQFRKYDHLERMGHDEVDGLDLGTVYVFPKLDGTNASIWWNGSRILCASRNRVLTAEHDNAGFCGWLNGEGPCQWFLRHFCKRHPNLVIYGEWLVPHSLKTYRTEAWSRFWVFDVYDRDAERYLSFDQYSKLLAPEPSTPGCDLVEPLAVITNPTQDQLHTLVEQNTYLIADNAGHGEGIVCKNYEWRNRHGRQPWMKIVANAFKEANARTFGPRQIKGADLVEQKIVDEFVTPHLVGKTRAKVVLDVANDAHINTADPNYQQHVEANHRHRVIPQLLGRVFHDLVEEECWSFVKKFKNPTIDFRKLNQLVNVRVKQLATDLF
jgi:hypothetical protein